MLIRFIGLPTPDNIREATSYYQRYSNYILTPRINGGFLEIYRRNDLISRIRNTGVESNYSNLLREDGGSLFYNSIRPVTINRYRVFYASELVIFLIYCYGYSNYREYLVSESISIHGKDTNSTDKSFDYFIKNAKNNFYDLYIQSIDTIGFSPSSPYSLSSRNEDFNNYFDYFMSSIPSGYMFKPLIFPQSPAKFLDVDFARYYITYVINNYYALLISSSSLYINPSIFDSFTSNFLNPSLISFQRNRVFSAKSLDGTYNLSDSLGSLVNVRL